MAIRKKIWIYPDVNPTVAIQFNSNSGSTISSSTVADYISVSFFQSLTSTNGYIYGYIPISGSYTVQAGDYMEYDIYLPNNTPALGTDMHFANGTLRDAAGVTDQNGIVCHPSTDLSPYAGGKWYHRVIPITTSTGGSTVGVLVNYFNIVSEQDPVGTYVAYYKNLAITDGQGTGEYNISSFHQLL